MAIFERYSREDLVRPVDGSRLLCAGDDGSHHAFTVRSWESTRRFSPTLFAVMLLAWSSITRLGEAITFVRNFNASGTVKAPRKTLRVTGARKTP